MSFSKDLPPPYDQTTTIDIDNGTAPLLCETFSGSIFGTSTVVKFELAFGSNPQHISTGEGCDHSFFDKATDYSFVVRDFLECVQANGKVANTREDLHTTLLDIRETEIFQFRKRAYDIIEPPATPPSNATSFVGIIFNKKKANIDHTFEVSHKGQLIGLVTYGDEKPPETCLRVYMGRGESELVVKSASLGEFVIFRDRSSSGPLCNIKAEPYEFTGKIVFHPETGITTDEQLLCTAAAFAFKTCKTKQDMRAGNRGAIQIYFWAIFTSAAVMLLIGLLLLAQRVF